MKDLLEKLPVTLRIQVQISNIIARAQRALLNLGLLVMTLQQERAMDAILLGFDKEINSLESPNLSGKGHTKNVKEY